MGINPAIVAGNMMIEEAKSGGLTPAVFIYKGRWVDCPPYTFLPTTLFAYCTGIFLCPLSSKIMPATTATIITVRKITKKIESSFACKPDSTDNCVGNLLRSRRI
jgi:hypothetical protein